MANHYEIECELDINEDETPPMDEEQNEPQEIPAQPAPAPQPTPEPQPVQVIPTAPKMEEISEEDEYVADFIQEAKETINMCMGDEEQLRLYMGAHLAMAEMFRKELHKKKLL